MLSEWLVVEDDSNILQELSVPIFSSMLVVKDAGQVPEGNVISTELTLGIGARLLMVDRCYSSCLTHRGKALAEGFEDLDRHVGLGM